MNKILICLLCLILSHFPSLVAEDESGEEASFVILISSLNNKKWVKKNLDSVCSQSYDLFRVIYVDEGSQDGTVECVQDYIQKNSLHGKISLLRNDPSGNSLSRILGTCSSHEILLFLDGSDWLAHRDVLKQLSTAYASGDVWLTYGQYCTYPGFSRGNVVPISHSALDPADLSTFKSITCFAGLAQELQEELKKQTPAFFASLLTVAGPHAQYIQEIHYIYNQQKKRSAPPDPTRPVSPKKIYITPGLWGELFSISNPVFNRDNCLDVLYRLREEAHQAGFEMRQADDLTSLQDFEYLIVFDVFPEQLALLERYPKEKKILFLWEPPSVLPENYNLDNHRSFSKVFTWNDNLVDNQKYFKFYYPVLNPMIDSTIDFHSRKLCTLIACNKESQVPGELYSERRSLIHFFEYGPHQGFTLYGKYWPHYRVYGGPIERKVDTLKNFRFCFAYENIRNVTGYVTEKIFDCFHAGTVPIYWGAPNISDYIPKDCYISREDFPDNESLHFWLGSMDEEQHLTYLNNIRAFLQSEEAQRFSKEYFISLVMKLINTPPSKD